MKKAVFFDKDGTLIRDVPYNTDPELISLNEYAGDCIRSLMKEYMIIVISNQAGVAHGYFKETDLFSVNQAMNLLLAASDARIDYYYYCPHHPEGNLQSYAIECDCRKPAPGLLLRAAREHGIDLSRSWMVGDIASDTEAGNRAGCRTIWMGNPNSRPAFSEAARPCYTARNLLDVADIILKCAVCKPANTDKYAWQMEKL